MVIWYHGTTKENTEKILKEGFREGTYFTWDMSSALTMGGDYIFFVYFKEAPTKYWQYISSDPIPKKRIERLIKIEPEVLYRNDDLEEKIKEEIHREEYGEKAKHCKRCRGKGELNDFPLYARWRDRKGIEVCPDCRGYGITNREELYNEL